VGTHRLPDGRSLEVDRTADEVHWHLRIEGDPSAELVGAPLNSALAELLGYRVAHERWPEWIDILAAEIEGSFGRH
jgi:hypothetical protein